MSLSTTLQIYRDGRWVPAATVQPLGPARCRIDRDGANAVLEFRPQPQQDMLVACLWSHWTPPAGSDETELLSFAAITDEPPQKLA